MILKHVDIELSLRFENVTIDFFMKKLFIYLDEDMFSKREQINRRSKLNRDSRISVKQHCN